jgi:hypothetical protein
MKAIITSIDEEFEKAQVKGFTRTKKGKLERVNPFSRKGDAKGRGRPFTPHGDDMTTYSSRDDDRRWERGKSGKEKQLDKQLDKLDRQSGHAGGFKTAKEMKGYYKTTEGKKYSEERAKLVKQIRKVRGY